MTLVVVHFDVSILELEMEYLKFATSGDNLLGGDDFDQAIIDYLVEEFKKNKVSIYHKIKWQCNVLKMQQKKLKKDLSGVTSTQISLPFISAGANGPVHLENTLTRAKFDELTHNLVERTLIPTRQALKDAGLNPSEIDQVILVGGSTRIPAVQEAVKKKWAKSLIKV